MNEYSLYTHAHNHMEEMHQWADREQLARAVQNRPLRRRTHLTMRAALWIGQEMIAMGTVLKTRAEYRLSPLHP